MLSDERIRGISGKFCGMENNKVTFSVATLSAFALAIEQEVIGKQVRNVARWLHFASSPQTAVMLGSSLPVDSEQDWVAECNELADWLMRKDLEKC